MEPRSWSESVEKQIDYWDTVPQIEAAWPRPLCVLLYPSGEECVVPFSSRHLYGTENVVTHLLPQEN